MFATCKDIGLATGSDYNRFFNRKGECMKKRILTTSLAVLLLMSFQTAAQGATAESVSGNKFFCIGMLVGFVEGHVPGLRPVAGTFAFSKAVFSIGVLTMEGVNDAVGAYKIENEGFGGERISATCVGFDGEKGLGLTYEVKVTNMLDIFIVGTIQVDGIKDFEDAGSAAGFFFGLRKIFD